MIRVTVELVSAVSSTRDKLLGIAYIGRHKTKPGEYTVWLSKWAPRESQQWKAGRLGMTNDQLDGDVLRGSIVGFDNVKRGAWDLLFLALRAVVGSRNP